MDTWVGGRRPRRGARAPWSPLAGVGGHERVGAGALLVTPCPRGPPGRAPPRRRWPASWPGPSWEPEAELHARRAPPFTLGTADGTGAPRATAQRCVTRELMRTAAAPCSAPV